LDQIRIGKKDENSSTKINPEQVGCRKWNDVVKSNRIWKPLLERKVKNDSNWKELAERRGWIRTMEKYFIKPREKFTNQIEFFLRIWID
jgi:hypothetical protein